MEKNKLKSILNQISTKNDSNTIYTTVNSNNSKSNCSGGTYIGDYSQQINTYGRLNQYPSLNDNIYTTTTTGTYYDTNYLLRKELEETKTNLDFLMKFLIMKGIIKDEQEFKDFIDATNLANKLGEVNKDTGLPEELGGCYKYLNALKK